MNKFVTCLWFDDQAEEAAKFYVSVFKDGKLGDVARYPGAGEETHHQPAGKVMTAEFEVNGQAFVGLNGGPMFKFTEAVSFQIMCETQTDIDMYWSKLTADGGQESQCGWLKDKFGLSWQVVAAPLIRMMKDKDANKRNRVMGAMMQMKKLDIAVLEKACAG